MAERCLQEITGSCSGCNIRDNILVPRLNGNGGYPKEEVARQVQAEWCPEGASIQMPESHRVRIWEGLGAIILKSGESGANTEAAQPAKA